MDVWFCEGRNHRREAKMRAERFHIRKVRALPSAPGHPCFSLTEDLHGCLVLRRQEPPPRGKMRAERFHIRKVRALPSAPGHPCFSLTEDLHGCLVLRRQEPP